MNYILLFIIISLIPIINSSYNPISIGSVIVSTTRKISVLQPKEYGGTDKSKIIFTATKTMTIVNTIFNPTSRILYILFTNTTNNIIYISQLISIENLDSIVYQLPILFNLSNINKLTSFSSDVNNKRAFFTDQTGNVIMFSMSGLMKIIISIPSTIKNPIRSVDYNQRLNRLFIITDSTVDSCINLDQNNLQCCQALPKTDQLRSITFDPTTNHLFAYVIDEQTGIYQVILNRTGCPIALRPINTIDTYRNIHLAIYQNLYFYSGNSDNSKLIIDNGIDIPRTISFDASIVALHISYPHIKSIINNEETCFHGITYHDYRLALVLAAIFGTIMGIFMCFNALFCIDFFMTKRIIRDLKKQIPPNSLEDHWNKLIREKYTKLAVEIHQKKHNSLLEHNSSDSVQKVPIDNNVQSRSRGEGFQISNPIPKISAYLRRKSESYLNRRRSDDYRPSSSSQNTTAGGIPQIPIGREDKKEIRDNINRDDPLKNERELL